MQELIYSYKKGQGWVLGYPDDMFVGESGGYRLTLEHRKPRIGERFYYLYLDGEHCKNGKVEFQLLFDRLTVMRNPPEFNSALFTELTQAFRDTYRWDSVNYTHVTITVTRTT